MIRITVNDSIVEDHFKGVKLLFEGKRIKYKYDDIDKWIKEITDNTYNFEYIIKAKPEKLKKIIEKVNQCNKNIKIKKIKKTGERKEITEEKFLYDQNDYMLFVYKKFASAGREDNANSINEYGAVKLVNNLGIKVCPYCNRNYIVNTKIRNRNHEKQIYRTAQLDHFYPESTYPYLSLSFYNLIPVCPVCNKIKLMNEISINPYNIINSDDNIIFDYDFEETINKKVISTNYISKEFESNWELLGLEELYKSHSDYLNDLLERMQIYNELYINDLNKKIQYIVEKSDEQKSNLEEKKKTEKTILEKYSNKKLKQLILGNYYKEEDLSKQPLSKLTKDIYNKYKN